MIDTLIIGLEKAALEKWNRGDPSGYIDIFADDINYYDPATELRLDGIDAMRRYLEPIKGLVRVEKYIMLNPKVQATRRMAVLTFNLDSYNEGKIQKWNSTEVYRLERNGKWKIIHSHWSYVKHGGF
jgi:ketosteroid isomerase-like protein